jgi:hypothetical protein
MDNSNVNTERRRKSDKLLPAEFTEFKKKVDSFDTKIDAAEFFGFSTVTLEAVTFKKGKGRPDTIQKIRLGLGLECRLAS